MASSQNEAHPTTENGDVVPQPTSPPPSYSAAATTAFLDAHPNPDLSAFASQTTPRPPGGQPYCPQQPGTSYGYPATATYANAESQGVGGGAYRAASAAGSTFVIVGDGGSSNVPMAAAMALSCVVFWCFFGVFGGIAFILALVGQNANTSGDARRAMQWRNASYTVSAVGVVVGVVVIGIIIGTSTTTASKNSYYSYYSYYYNPTRYYSSYSYYKPYKTYYRG